MRTEAVHQLETTITFTLVACVFGRQWDGRRKRIRPKRHPGHYDTCVMTNPDLFYESEREYHTSRKEICACQNITLVIINTFIGHYVVIL